MTDSPLMRQSGRPLPGSRPDGACSVLTCGEMAAWEANVEKLGGWVPYCADCAEGVFAAGYEVRRWAPGADLRSLPDVPEATSSSVSPNSPFGI